MNKVSLLFSTLKANIAEIVYVLFALRLIAFGASIGEALALLSFTGLLAYKFLLSKKQLNAEETIIQEIQTLKDSLTAVRVTQSLISNKGKLPNEQAPAQTKRFV